MLAQTPHKNKAFGGFRAGPNGLPCARTERVLGRGFHQASMREIARAAGLSLAGLRLPGR